MEATAIEVARVLLSAGAVALRPDDPFRFASGILSPVYCDNRLLLGDLAARRSVSQALAQQIAEQGGEYELIAGTATAGIAWAAWVAELLERPMAYVRSGAKAYGKGKQIEGGSQAGWRTILIEDAVSTGGSSLAAVAALREAELPVEHCWTIYSYQMPAALEGFAAAGVQLHPLTTLPSLLQAGVEQGAISAQGRAIIEGWAADPQGWESRRA